MEGLSPEERSNMATGHKANLSNPNTSEASKQHSREELKKLGGEDAFYEKDKGDAAPDANMGNPGNVIGGYKATLERDDVSQEAKDHAKKMLDGNKDIA